ncbi:hypothetical protein ABIF61_003455 [Bradyrhizobium japonicum]
MPNSRAGIPAPGASDGETKSVHVQEPAAVSRKSALSRHANSLVEPELPLRAYFLSVGGALLLLLLAADWVLPAPLPSRLTDSHSALPPIRIHTELKGPEAVIIDTIGFGLLPMPPEHDIAVAPSQLLEPEVANAAVIISDSSPAPTTDLRLRESLARLQSPVHDQASKATRPRDVAARQRTLAQARPGKRRRSARHPGFETSRGGCVSLSREHGPCRYALVPN